MRHMKARGYCWPVSQSAHKAMCALPLPIVLECAVPAIRPIERPIQALVAVMTNVVRKPCGSLTFGNRHRYPDFGHSFRNFGIFGGANARNPYAPTEFSTPATGGPLNWR